MFFRCVFIIFCILTFIVITSAVKNSSGDASELHGGPRGANLALAMRIITRVLGKSVALCPIEPAINCELFWNNSDALIKCATIYAEAHKDRCLGE